MMTAWESAVSVWELSAGGNSTIPLGVSADYLGIRTTYNLPACLGISDNINADYLPIVVT